jgi:hypothetical protein
LIAAVPRSLRGDHYPEPGAVDEYRPPSLLQQYWGLAAVFVIALIAIGVYFYKLPRTAIYFAPPAVYVEPLPAQPAQHP